MYRHTGATLVVPLRHLVRKVIVYYARWWHGVAGVTCPTIDISKSPSLSGQGKEKRGLRPALTNLKIYHFLGSLPHPQVRGGRG